MKSVTVRRRPLQVTKKILPFESASGPVAYALVRRRGQKHINIRVHHDGRVTVSAPAHTSNERVFDAIRAKRQWICSHVDRAKEKKAGIDELSSLPVGGIPHKVTIEYAPAKRGLVRLAPESREIMLRTPDKSRQKRLDQLSGFLKRYCAQTVSPEVLALSQLMKVNINRISYRNQKTRWGSSSARGNISLNFRIALLPPEKRKYLIIHELAHQVHMNHSADFWQHLAAWEPNYRENDGWLKEHAFFLGLLRT